MHKDETIFEFNVCLLEIADNSIVISENIWEETISHEGYSHWGSSKCLYDEINESIGSLLTFEMAIDDKFKKTVRVSRSKHILLTLKTKQIMKVTKIWSNLYW